MGVLPSPTPIVNDWTSPQRCHGDDAIPEWDRDIGELRAAMLGRVIFRKIRQRWEHDVQRQKREHDPAKLSRGATNRPHEVLELARVPRELRDAEDAQPTQRSQRRVQCVAFEVRELFHERRVVGQDPQQVHQVVELAHERPAVRRGEQPRRVLKREDGDAERIQDKERFGVQPAVAPVRRGFRLDAARAAAVGAVRGFCSGWDRLRYNRADIEQNDDAEKVAERTRCHAAFVVSEKLPRARFHSSVRVRSTNRRSYRLLRLLLLSFVNFLEVDVRAATFRNLLNRNPIKRELF